MTDEVAEITLGPAMQALTEKQRRFVLAMAAGSVCVARRMGARRRLLERAKVSASACCARQRSRRRCTKSAGSSSTLSGPALATAALLRAAGNPKHKGHLKAAELIANRVGMHEVREVRVEHRDEPLRG